MGSTYAGHDFARTAWTLIRRAQDPGSDGYRDAINRLYQVYWRPVYSTIRWGWRRSREAAEDLTQEYFAAFFEKDLLAGVSEGQGRFRAFVKATLKNFMLMENRAERTEKRGGGRTFFSLDAAPLEAAAPSGSPEEIFDREWMRSVFDEALKSLQGRMRADAFDLFHRYYMGAPVTYEALAAETGRTTTNIKNVLHQARADFREAVIELLRDGVADEAQLEADVREVLGIG